MVAKMRKLDIDRRTGIHRMKYKTRSHKKIKKKKNKKLA